MIKQINILSTSIKEPPSGRIFHYSTELQKDLPIYEVEESWLPFIKLVDNEVIKDEEWKKTVLEDRIKWKIRKKLEQEISSLEEWFINYDIAIQKYNREVRLGLDLTININELDRQAEINRIRLRQLKIQVMID